MGVYIAQKESDVTSVRLNMDLLIVLTGFTRTFNKEKKKIEEGVIGESKQYPLKLALAITIHKSQSLTFEKLVVDFGTGTFTSGQTYTFTLPKYV